VNSKILSNFKNGISFDLKDKDKILDLLPGAEGIYIMRLRKPFGRLKGKSDILCIGSSIGAGGLKDRIKFYFRPGPTQRTILRIFNALSKQKNVEISAFTTTEGRARKAEKRCR
jgi:hypothetical protein